MRQYTDELTNTTHYVMNSAELMRYRYNIIKEHEMKKKRRKQKLIKQIMKLMSKMAKEVLEGFIMIALVYGSIFLMLWLSA